MRGAVPRIVVALLLPFAVAVGAVEGIQLALERIVAPWGSLAGISLNLKALSVQGAQLELTVEEIVLSPALGGQALSLECPRLLVERSRLRCAQGTLRFKESPFGGARMDSAFEFDPAAAELRLSLSGSDVAGGRLDLRLESRRGAWSVRGGLAGGQVGELMGWGGRFRDDLQGWKSAGSTTLRFDLAGEGETLSRMELTGSVQRASLEAPDGKVAAVGIDADFRLGLTPRREGTGFAGGVSLGKGEFYLEPFYWEGSAGGPLSLEFDLVRRPGRLEVERLVFDDPGTVRGEAKGVLTEEEGGWRPQTLDLDLQKVQTGPAYRRYVQPLMADAPWNRLEMAGTLRGSVRWRDGAVHRAEMDLDSLSVDDPSGGLGIYGLGGGVGWSAGDAAVESSLRWDGGHFLALDLGKGALSAVCREGRLSLNRSFELPLLDGALLIDGLQFAYAPSDGVEWELDAVLTPVSMERLSHALGWPRMSGRLSGVIPRLRYRDGEMTVGGDLLARAFDGEVLIQGLRLVHPFEGFSRAYAEVTMRRLDLDELTHTFAFGSIQGRLSGEVKGLELEQWRPVAFDAWFATPEGDESRHRISQKAVENLSQLGGGALGGALSRGFLGLFEEFNYDRIGIGCRLRNGVCRMKGVAPTDGGYYLVKGGGLPRVDIVGYAREVDWDEMVARLRHVTLDNPVIR